MDGWYHHRMLEDVIGFDTAWGQAGSAAVERGASLRSRAVGAFVRFMERRLGARFVYDAAKVPFGRPELLDLFAIAERMRRQGMLQSYRPTQGLADEPRVFAWRADLASTESGGGKEQHTASGAHHADDRAALIATLAEAAERSVWYEQTDYLGTTRLATAGEIVQHASAVLPERFAGFSAAQRDAAPHLRLLPQSRYLWVRGHSWVSGKPVWIPAQVVSGNRALAAERRLRGEPSILSNSTNGLATRQSQAGAVFYGTLELVERDAYMVAWLGQLTPPQFDLDDLCRRSDSLAKLVAMCRRYRLEPRAVRLFTDAPTYAVCAVLEDTTHAAPRITLGLRAHKDPAYAVEKALLEALRMRQVARNMLKYPPEKWRPDTPAGEIGHMDRLLYWAVGGRAERLAFLTAGPVERFAEPWEEDTEDEHLARILAWCRTRGYECASVSMTRSRGNPTPWHIEMVVMPELQPIHLHERAQHLGGARLGEIPRLFGQTPRLAPYTDDPHPFA